MNAKKWIGSCVVVTTTHRGVCFGVLEDVKKSSVELSGCRNAVYWSRDLRGFLGLATDGPSGTCRIGPAAMRTMLVDVTSITLASADAIKRWESAPWSE